jgi:hypothetical protein
MHSQAKLPKLELKTRQKQPISFRAPSTTLWKDWFFAYWAKAYWHKSQQHQFCANVIHWCHLFQSKLVLKVMQQDDTSCLVARCVMEGSMVFCQKNILEHSMGFHGVPFFNTQGQSDIVTHKTNKVYLSKPTFFYNTSFFATTSLTTKKTSFIWSTPILPGSS